jgi:hypothetical protein
LICRPWILFLDSPVIGVDGFYLKDWIDQEVDVDEPMALSMARLLRRVEDKYDHDSNGKCHYVLHDWAVSLL